ncbi:MAG: YSC84-related protein [Candidatus Methylomirabilota bacterium]
MWRSVRILGSAIMVAMAVTPLMRPSPVMAASGAELNRDTAAALQTLYERTPAAKEVGTKAKGILVFPSIIKAGFIVGGQYGEGALRKGGKTVAYYNTVAASYGLQAGAQAFGYALFFMTDAALKYLDKSGGWEIGTGPSVVIVDEGMARALTTTTAQSEIYAFFFDQKGLMAGLGLQGSKISRINK